MAKKRGVRGRGSVYKRGSVWWIKYYRDGKPVREPSGSRVKQDAVELLDRRRVDGSSGLSAAAHKITMGEIFELVVDDYVESEKRDLYILKKRIAKHLTPTMGSVKAADFGTAHVKRYKAKRKSEGAAAATINRELAIIRRGLNIAAKETDPPLISHAIAVKGIEEKNARQGFLEHSQYLELRNVLVRARLPFVIGYHIGNRTGEILRLEWSMVDFAANELRLPGVIAKNKKPRTAPLYGDLREMLLIAKEERDLKFPHCPWVCADNGKQIKSFKREWWSATEAVGLKGLLFHDLRRTAVRNMVRAGIPESVAMKISGHVTRSVFDRYDISSKRDIADAGAKMADYLSSHLVTAVKSQDGHSNGTDDLSNDLSLGGGKNTIN